MLLAVWHLCSNVKRPVDHRSENNAMGRSTHHFRGKLVGTCLRHLWWKRISLKRAAGSYFGKSSTLPLWSICPFFNTMLWIERITSWLCIHVYVYMCLYIYTKIIQNIWGKHFYAHKNKPTCKTPAPRRKLRSHKLACFMNSIEIRVKTHRIPWKNGIFTYMKTIKINH